MNLNLNSILDAEKRISSFLDPEMIMLISNAVIKSHFSYGLVIWTFSFGKFNNKYNLQQVSKNTVWWYDNMGSTFQDVLQLSKSVSVHYKNI